MKKTLSAFRCICICLLLTASKLLYGQSGSLNKSFGTNGFRITKVSDQNNTQASTTNILINENADTYSVMRFGGTVIYKRDGDGLPVTNYGNGGFSDHFNFGENANCLLPDGSVLFAGFVGISPSFMEQPVTANLAIGKLNKYGKWDQQFGPNGLKILFETKSSLQALGIGVLANGKILVILRDYIFEANKLILVTLLPSGDIDPSLPDNGQLQLPFGEALETIEVPAIVKQPDGKWILGVREHPTTGGSVRNYLVRLNPDGKPDTGFGTGGVKSLDSYLPPDENLVAVGCKKEGGYTLLTSNVANFLTLRVSHFTASGIPDASKGGVFAQPIDLPFTAGFRSAVFDDNNRFSLLVAEEPIDYNNHFLVRLDATGKPDPTFNQVGYLQLLQSYLTIYTGLAITPKKNLMVLGNSYDSPYSFILQKILAKGQPDPFYDQDGTVTVSYPYSSFEWTSLLKISDVKLVAGGFTRKNGKPYWLMEAVDADGRPDASFGNRGNILVPLPSTVRFVSMELTPNSQIIVYGFTDSPPNANQVFLYKFFADGHRDLSWASNGQKILTTGRSLNNVRLTTQKDGRILLAYDFFIVTDGTNTSDISIQRLLANGQPDRTFGFSGSRLIDVGQNADQIQQLKVQEDGKILLINATFLGQNALLSVIRLLSDGKYDPGYLQGMKAIPATSASFDTYGALVKKDNKLLIAGNNHPHYYSSVAALLQLNANGSIDRSFGTNGVYLNPFSTEQAIGADVNLLPDGKLIFTCRDFGNYIGDIINLRLYPNGTLDQSFGTNGQSQHSYATGAENVYKAKVLPGQLVMAGFSELPLKRGMLMSIWLDNNTTLQPIALAEATAPALLVYPNPAKGQLTIRWSDATTAPQTIQLYDMDGKMLQTWQAQNFKGMGQQQLLLSNHSSGNYLLRIIYADGTTRQEKIVIIR